MSTTVSTGLHDVSPPIGDQARARIGRAMTGTSIVATGAGLVAVAALGRWSSLVDDATLTLALAAVGFGALAWVTLAAQPRNSAVWVLVWTAVFAALAVIGDASEAWVTRDMADPDDIDLLTPADVSLPSAVGLWLAGWPGILPFFLPSSLAMLLFPDGRPPSQRWRWVGWATVLALAMMVLPFLYVTNPTSDYTYGPGEGSTQPDVVGLIFGIGYLASVTLGFACLAGLIVRYRHADHETRRQIRVVVAGFVCFVVCLSGSVIVDAFTDGGLNEGAVLLDRLLLLTGMLVLLIAFAVGVLKFRLYDLDVIVSKGALYLSLAVFITALYVVLVVAVGALLGEEADTVSSIAAVIVVAAAFQPARRFLERAANRLVFGSRVTPYEVLARFSRRAVTSDGDELMTRIPSLVVEGTSAVRATLWIRTEAGFRPASSWPAPVDNGDSTADDFAVDGADRSIPIEHDGEVLGRLSLVLGRGETISPAEDGLVAGLAAGLGMVMRNGRMTSDLRQRVAELEASRQRILAAAADARRGLERDLDRGPQRELGELRLALAATSDLARRTGSDQVAGLLDQLNTEVEVAIDTVKDFARGVYPPRLEAEGLTAALGEQAGHAPIATTIQCAGVGRHARDAETAVYFAVLEALQNTYKHAGASSVVVRLSDDGPRLEFSVADDGGGFDPATVTGTAGLTGLRDRLDAVGGRVRVDSAVGRGTTVSGSVPV